MPTNVSDVTTPNTNTITTPTTDNTTSDTIYWYYLSCYCASANTNVSNVTFLLMLIRSRITTNNTTDNTTDPNVTNINTPTNVPTGVDVYYQC